jgi:ankyrin repeat protein
MIRKYLGKQRKNLDLIDEVVEARLIRQLEANQSILEKTDKHKYDYEEYATILHREEYEEYATKIIDLCPSLVRVANVDGNTPLHLAAEIGNEFILWKMLRCGEADCRKINKQGQTAFILACLNNHVAVALTLLQYMRSMTMVELDAAFSRHQPVLINRILAKFPNLVIDVDGEQSTILHKAVTQRNEEYAMKIIDLCPSLVSVTNVDGNTPLHLAAEIGNESILWKMLRCGRADCMKINKQGQTAFILACLNNHLDAALTLVENMRSMTMVELDAAFTGQQPVIIDKMLEKFPSLVLDVDEEQSTLLHKAVTQRNEEYATKVIDLCPSLVSVTNVDGNTPLHLAAEIGNINILWKMLETGEAECMKINKQGQTAFILACLNNNVNSARILVEGTSSMTMVELNAAFSEQQQVIIDSILEKFPNLILDADEEQSTLLHKACKSGNLEMARTLLDVDVNQEIAEKVDKDGLTPLHRAVINGSVEILKEFLCKAPSSFNITTQGTIETVFHLAAKYQKTKAFIFMAQSANIRQLLYSLDAEDNTVLHVAASVDSTSLVRHILSETTIDVTLKNKKGFAAVDLIDKEGVDFPLLSLWFRDEAEKIQRPARYVKFAHEPVELIRNTNNGEKLSSESRAMDLLREGRDPRNKEREMHSESLQNARNTITIVAVLIASVAFTCGINPPGGVHQDGPFIGKATAGRTLAFKIFSVANNIALFTSLSIVTLLVSIISYRTKALKMCVVIAHKMMWLAVASMATAYAASAWITVPHNEGSKWLVYTTSAIASVALGSMFVYVSFMMVKHILKKDKLRRNQSHGKTPSTTLDMEAAGDVGCYWF